MLRVGEAIQKPGNSTSKRKAERIGVNIEVIKKTEVIRELKKERRSTE